MSLKVKIIFAPILVVLFLVLLTVEVRHSPAQERALSVDEIVYLLEQQVPPPRVVALVEELGVNFEVTRTIRIRLEKAGADSAVLSATEKAAVALSRERLKREQQALETARERLQKEHSQHKEAAGESVEEEPGESWITTLLARARRQERTQQLTTPTGNNALETYRKILRRAPEHPQAQAGIRRIRDRYIRWATAARNRQEWSEALDYYKKALKTAPQDDTLLAAIAHIKQQQEEARSIVPSNHPPQITQYFPSEKTVSMALGEQRNFLAAAVDPDGGEISYAWKVDEQLVTQEERFTFSARRAGRYRLTLTVTDRQGLTVEWHWAVQVQATVAQPRLVIFTPHHSRVSLFPHQSRLFAVQIEVPGQVGSPLQYQWAVNGQSVSHQEVFDFKEPPIGSHEISVTVTDVSGARLHHSWTAEVRGVEEGDEIPPLWWPRTRAFGIQVAVSPDDPQQITITGKVRNQDDSRSADNVIVEIIGFDGKGQTRVRAFALPTPQPLPPQEVGTFRITISSERQLGFRPATLRKREEDEDYQVVKDRLVQRAERKQQEGSWQEAEALIKTAMKVYPPDERALQAQLREIQKAQGKVPPAPKRPTSTSRRNAATQREVARGK